MTPRSPRKFLGVMFLAVVLSSCSTSGPSASDKQFVGEMIPHHNVGVDLLQIGQLRSNDVRVRRMIFDMGDYHHQDLHTLEMYAQDWEVAESKNFDGNISNMELTRLRSAKGHEHDLMWLELMIRHHEGALVIARRVLQFGGNENLQTMARSVITVQADEIVQMVRLRKDLCSLHSTC